MKKLLIAFIVGMFLLSCSGLQVVENRPVRETTTEGFVIPYVDECFVADDGRNWCVLAEARHPEYHHIMQWYDVSEVDENGDGVCDTAWLFVAQTKEDVYGQGAGEEIIWTGVGPRECESAKAEVFEAIKKSGKKIEDIYITGKRLKK